LTKFELDFEKCHGITILAHMVVFVYNSIPSLSHIFAAVFWLLTLLSHHADSKLKYFLPDIECWTVVWLLNAVMSVT